MNIALDYDKTYNLHPDFWDEFINMCVESPIKIDIRLVTARSPTKDTLSKIQFPWQDTIPVIYCDGVAKQFVCHHFHDWDVDIWIDDKPQGVHNNSTASKEVLAAWRASEEYNV